MLQYRLQNLKGENVGKKEFLDLMNNTFPNFTLGPIRKRAKFLMEIYEITEGTEKIGRIDIAYRNIAYKSGKTHMIITSEENEKNLINKLKEKSDFKFVDLE